LNLYVFFRAIFLSVESAQQEQGKLLSLMKS